MHASRGRRVVRCAAMALGAALALARPARLEAHPEGTSSINRYLDFEYEGHGHFRVAYRLDFAEGPAYAEIDAADADHDGALTPAEQRRYLDGRFRRLVEGWVVEMMGEPAHTSIVASHFEASPGQGGLETLRIDCEVAVDGREPPPGEGLTLHVRDDAFASYAGWRQILVHDAAHEEVSEIAPARRPGSGGAADSSPLGSLRLSDARFELAPKAPSPRTWPEHAETSGLGPAAKAVLAALGFTFLVVLLGRARTRRKRQRV